MEENVSFGWPDGGKLIDTLLSFMHKCSLWGFQAHIYCGPSAIRALGYGQHGCECGIINIASHGSAHEYAV